VVHWSQVQRRLIRMVVLVIWGDPLLALLLLEDLVALLLWERPVATSSFGGPGGPPSFGGFYGQPPAPPVPPTADLFGGGAPPVEANNIIPGPAFLQRLLQLPHRLLPLRLILSVGAPQQLLPSFLPQPRLIPLE